jgi:ferredoxin-NADP reductase
MSVPQKVRCVVKNIIDHNDHVYTLELNPEHQIPVFLPGQFMHLAIDPFEPGDFWPDSRVFSIASTPTNRNTLSLTYSVIGYFTKKMEELLKVGSEVWVKLPYGEFVIDNSKEIVLIAGGTGITAFAAFLEGMIPQREQKVTLFYGARKSDLLIFRPLVERKLTEVEKFSAWYFSEIREQNELNNFISGRISVDEILQKIDSESKPAFYISGPPAMLKKISSDLVLKGISRDLIKTDAWE